jgi:hypothetical protein
MSAGAGAAAGRRRGQIRVTHAACMHTYTHAVQEDLHDLHDLHDLCRVFIWLTEQRQACGLMLS